MNPFLYSHVSDGALRRDMLAAVPRLHLASTTAIAHIAEFDARRLYVPEGYPSMAAFCTRELGLTEQVALKLIRVGRTARRHPEVFLALADGRLNATAVIILSPGLTGENARELIDAASHRSNEEIREMLADRNPRLDTPLEVGVGQVSAQTVPGLGELAEPFATGSDIVCAQSVPSPEKAFAQTVQSASEVSAQTSRFSERPRHRPLGLGRLEVRFTMAQNARGALRQLEELLGRAVTSDEMSEAVRLGLEMLISTLEKRRYAATDRPRRTRGNTRGRRIPAAVKREVAARDGRRCTYVSADGRRCAARGRLEYDHIVPVARGGASTAANLRLRCRAHNQYEAEQVFGVGFMHEKRQRAGRVARAGQAAGIEHQQTTTPRVAATKDRTAAIMRREARLRTQPGPRPRDEAIIPCLRQLGFRSGEVKRAAEHCATLREAPLEQRVREALRLLAPHGGVRRVEPLRSPQP